MKQESLSWQLKKLLFQLFSLIYYHLTPDKSLPGTTILGYHDITAEKFEQHVKFIKQHYQLISLDQLVSRENVPANSVVITFDDGLASHYEQVFPVLKEYEVPAIFYLATNFIDENKFFDYSGGDKKEAITWSQVREMVKSNLVDFGAHTLSHPILTRINAKEAEQEIRVSKRRIEQELSLEVKHFAYPNGREQDFDGKIKKLVQEAGFASAVTLVGGTIDTEDLRDPYQLKRIRVAKDYGVARLFASMKGLRKKVANIR